MDLPDLVLLHISAFWTFPFFDHLRCLSKEWKNITQETMLDRLNTMVNFAHQTDQQLNIDASESDRDQCITIYRQLTQTSPGGMKIMHGNNPEYWVVDEEQAMCRRVCWFDIYLEKPLWPGKFGVKIYIQFNGNFRENLNCTLEVLDPGGRQEPDSYPDILSVSQLQLPPQRLESYWIDLGTVEIDKTGQWVRVRAWKHSGVWVYNTIVKEVRFREL